MVGNPFIFIFAPSDGPLRFDGGRGGDPFRKPNSKLPDNKGNRPPLPPGFGGVLLGVLFGGLCLAAGRIQGRGKYQAHRYFPYGGYGVVVKPPGSRPGYEPE